MNRFRSFGLISLVAVGLIGSAWTIDEAHAAPPAKAAAAPTYTKPPPPSVKEAIRLTPEGLRLGMMQNDVVEFYNKVLDQDYVPIYKMTPIGPKMKEVDAALAEQKQALVNSEVVFGTLPTGIDNSPLKGEYNYKNGETMMSLTRQGVTRYFFFQNKKLWKFYDATPLKKEGDPGAPGYMGATYKDAIGILTKRFGVPGRVLAEDPAHGRNATEVEWADETIHVRAIDRSSENIVGLVFQERAGAARMAAFKAAQPSEEGGIDPAMAAIAKPGNAVDTNQTAADAYTGKAHAMQPSGPPAGPPPGQTPGPGPGKKKQ